MAENALLPDVSSYANPNGNRLLATASNDPNQMLGAALRAQALQSGQVQISQQQFELGKAKLAHLDQVLGSVAADPTPENFATQLSNAVRMGTIDANTAAQQSTKVAQLGGDPAKIRGYATDLLNQNATHEQIFDQAYGKTQMLNNGAVASPVTVKEGAQAGLYPAQGPSVQQQLSPEAATAPQEGPVNPDGSKTQVTRQQAVDRNGGLPVTVDAFGRIAYPNRAPAASSPVQGARQAAVASPAAAPPPAGPVTVGLAPGVSTAADATAAANVASFQTLQKAADQVPNIKSTISQMEQDLQLANTGPNAEKINTLKAGANVLADTAGLPAGARFDQKAIAATEKFRNASVQLATQQFQALGGSGTDSQLATASGDVPNPSVSKMGNKELLALNKGLRDALTVKNSAAQSYLKANPNGSYGTFAEDWNKTFSPRAFQLPYLSPDERKAVVASMSPQEKAQVKQAFDTAVTRGWIKPGGASQ